MTNSINIQTIEGCDKHSRIYYNSFNTLEPVLISNIEVTSNVDMLDKSALMLYIGKFVEQEINSSIVQLIRRVHGVTMPDYYCEYVPDRSIFVSAGNKRIEVNGYYYQLKNKVLKTIPLGDAYYALEDMLENPQYEFEEHEWLFETNFKDSWRQINYLRNKAAHIGNIISKDEIEKGIKAFSVFLSYLPQLNALKEELNPDYLENENAVEDSQSSNDIIKQAASIKQWRRMQEIEAIPHEERSKEMKNEYSCLYNDFDWNSIIYTAENGLKGMKDPGGNVIVPPRYDDFPYTFDTNGIYSSIPAIKDGKMGLVKIDDSGEELTSFEYDLILKITDDRAFPNEGYCYKKEGSLCYGLMSDDGEELLPCIIDEIIKPFSLALYFKRGDLWGMWDFFSNTILKPIYDDIELDYDEWGSPKPTVFTLNGVKGNVTINGDFIPSEELLSKDDGSINFIIDA